MMSRSAFSDCILVSSSSEPFWTAILARHILHEQYCQRSYGLLTMFVVSLGFGGTSL